MAVALETQVMHSKSLSASPCHLSYHKDLLPAMLSDTNVNVQRVSTKIIRLFLRHGELWKKSFSVRT